MLTAIKTPLMIKIVPNGEQCKIGHLGPPQRALTRKVTPAPCQCFSYLGKGDGSGHSLCLKSELPGLFFRAELNNTLEEVLMTSWVSADFPSHKAAGVAHRGSVAAGSLITFWDGWLF